jgi:hypothetical protein
MSLLRDFLGPKGDTVQILLKRQDKPVAAIYKDNEREIRSPSLKKDNAADEAPNRNNQ